MQAEVVLILPEAGAEHPVEVIGSTPYGDALGYRFDQLVCLVRTEGTDARSLIYAAKELGAKRVLAGDIVQPVSNLLDAGDLVVPLDVIDQTRLRPHTFFVGKGYGFIKLNPPFCPHVMADLIAVARSANPRSFGRAVYVCTEGPREATPAELRMFRQWGADVVGSSLLPEAYLARELELCYGALAIVGSAKDCAYLSGLLSQAAVRPAPSPRTCACPDTMKFMKEQGVVGEEWRTW